MNLFENLNPKQYEAITHTDGPLLILAGAGSGKTRVLTTRMAYLLAEKGASPFNLFAVTFTNKAAGEMKERVEKIIGPAARDMVVSTFHSACLRILRRHAGEIGYSSDFTIYDDGDQQQLINQCLDELKINSKMFHPRAVAANINRAKNNCIFAKDFPTDGLDFFSERIALIYPLYQKKLLQNQAMDFGDLILNMVQLFEKAPHVLEHYQSRFTHLHVDEYQDTNRTQYRLLTLLAAKHRNLCVVGDDDQSIYKFRGAEIKNILDFQKDYPDAHIVRLEQNYRSTGRILAAASAVVAKNSQRMGKTLWTENPEGEPVCLFQGLTEKDEAAFVVDEIEKRKRDSDLRYQDIAIFYRTNAQSRVFEDELKRKRIPYVLIGGTKFYDRQEIKDTLAYLRLLLNPADSISLKRVINVPARGIGKTTFEKLEAVSNQREVSMWRVLSEMQLAKTGMPYDASLIPTGNISPATQNKLTGFASLIQSLKSDSLSMPLIDFIRHFYEKSGLWKALEDENTIEAQARLENLEEFVNVVSEYVLQTENPTLDGFLDQAALVSSIDETDKDADRLPMMTLHLAKGLEFPVVFMVGLEEGLFPHSRSLNSEEDIEEERRLCYVGMTRAREKLHISFVRERKLFGSSQFNIPSRFLEEIPSEYLEQRSVKPKSQFTFNPPVKKEIERDYSFDQRDEDEINPFRRGVKVKHPVFGVGTIQSTEGSSQEQKLTIAFANGQSKKLLTKYANLEILR